jgi:hypothetical protein
MKTKTNLGGASRTVWEGARRAVAFRHGQFLLTLVVLRDNQNLVLPNFSIPAGPTQSRCTKLAWREARHNTSSEFSELLGETISHGGL